MQSETMGQRVASAIGLETDDAHVRRQRRADLELVGRPRTETGEVSLRARARSVERIARIDARTLMNEFILRDRPVVIANAIEDWPAMQRWTFEYLANTVESDPIRLRGAATGHYRYLGEVTYSEYARWLIGSSSLLLDRYERLHASKPYVAYAQNAGFEALRADFDFDRFTVPEHANARPAHWLGPEGATTPLHCDLGYVFNATIIGRKRWFLFAPSDTDKLYPAKTHEYEGTFSQIDVEAPDLERFPKFREATPYMLVAEPGDLLVLPEGWWHYVKCLEPSATISSAPYRGRWTAMPSRTRAGELATNLYERAKHFAHRRLGFRRQQCTCCFRVELSEQMGWVRREHGT
jgi:Cupin-like domain